MLKGQPLPLEKKFWSKVDKQGPVPDHRRKLGRCWIWTGKKKTGWGAFGIVSHTINGKTAEYRVHRVSWELHYGPIPDNLCVLHKCDNTSCVRPTHLFLGTRQDNMADKMAKGRYVSGMKGKKETEEHKRMRMHAIAEGRRRRRRELKGT
jgi:HNH endonuclease